MFNKIMGNPLATQEGLGRTPWVGGWLGTTAGPGPPAAFHPQGSLVVTANTQESLGLEM